MRGEVHEGEREGQATDEAQGTPAVSLAELCDRIGSLQVRRRFCIRQQVRLNNAVGALACWQLGWSIALPEKERERIRKRADKVMAALQKGEDVPDDLAEAAEVLRPYMLDTAIGLAPFDLRRKEVEKEMIRLAAETPGAAFVEQVRGFGMLGLAVILGETGDLHNYPNPEKLWKRLGWAPEEEYPKGEKSEGRKVPRRVKGELFGVVVEPLMRGNGEGRYKAIYDARKATYLARFEADGSKTPKLHAHKLAMRVMLKELLKDLWLAWRETRVAL